jgi:hypothetical protein
MTKAEALQEITEYVQAVEPPELSTSQLDMLARKAALNATVAATSLSYANDASVAGAVAQGWRLKMAKASGRFDYKDAAGQTFDRSQIFEHCKAMKEEWEAKAKALGLSMASSGISVKTITAPDVALLAHMPDKES